LHSSFASDEQSGKPSSKYMWRWVWILRNEDAKERVFQNASAGCFMWRWWTCLHNNVSCTQTTHEARCHIIRLVR